MTTDTHDINDLALRHIAVKLALIHIERLSKEQSALARDEFRLTLEPLMRKGFSGKTEKGTDRKGDYEKGTDLFLRTILKINLFPFLVPFFIPSFFFLFFLS